MIPSRYLLTAFSTLSFAFSVGCTAEVSEPLAEEMTSEAAFAASKAPKLVYEDTTYRVTKIDNGVAGIGERYELSISGARAHQLVALLESSSSPAISDDGRTIGTSSLTCMRGALAKCTTVTAENPLVESWFCAGPRIITRAIVFNDIAGDKFGEGGYDALVDAWTAASAAARGNFVCGRTSSGSFGYEPTLRTGCRIEILRTEEPCEF